MKRGKRRGLSSRFRSFFFLFPTQIRPSWEEEGRESGGKENNSIRGKNKCVSLSKEIFFRLS